MCFIFLFTWLSFTLRKKKKLAADTGAAQRSFGETRKVAVVDKNALKWDCWWDLAWCDSQLFCDALLVWPVLLSECKKKKKVGGVRSVSNTNRSHESRSGFEFLEEASVRTPELFCFPLTRSSFRLCCGSSSCVFGGGMSLLNQVMWAGACVHLQWTN